MSTLTLFALLAFGLAMTLESAVWLVFLHRLRRRHPKQWAHADQPANWQDRTLLSARSTMLYMKSYAFLSSLDKDGIRFCGQNRKAMLFAYWLTAITGATLLVSVAIWGW